MKNRDSFDIRLSQIYPEHMFVGLLFVILATTQSCQIKQEHDSTDIQRHEVVRVGPEGFSSSFSYYNTTPESMDGSLISYVKYLSVPEKERYEAITAEIWICNSDLSNHRKMVDIKMNGVHNGARLQWLDNNSFVYQDDSIRAMNIDGKVLISPIAGTIGHNPFERRFLYSAVDEETGLYSIYEHDVSTQKTLKMGDASDYKKIEEVFQLDTLRPLKDRKILHLQYSPDGKRISFRLDIGTKDEEYKHLITQNIEGGDIRFFGPKPMHFAWYDGNSIMGHDNQIDDGMPNDKSGRRWDLEGNYIETLSGPGNHLGASFDKQFFASESWYNQNPIILSVFEKGQTTPFWQDTVSIDTNVTWTLGNHVNPSFSRDNKRVYFNKCSEDNQVQAYMAVLKE